jgi:hypothetical protein
MENFSCEINEGKRFEKGPCLYEKGLTKQDNPTCLRCTYYRSCLSHKERTRNSSLNLEISKKSTDIDNNDQKILRQRAFILQKALEVPVKVDIEGDLYVLEVAEKPETRHMYGFTKKTRNEFKKILRTYLKNYDEGKAKNFINSIEGDVGHFISTRRYLNDRRYLYGQDLKDAKHSFEEAEKYILEICSGRLKVPIQLENSYGFKFEQPNDPLSGDLQYAAQEECYASAKVALRSIQSLLKNFKSGISIEKKKRGCPRADKDDLAFQLAMWFNEFIGRPRPLAGPFPKIVRRCFRICRINRDEGQRRAIESALKKLSSSSFPKK